MSTNIIKALFAILVIMSSTVQAQITGDYEVKYELGHDFGRLDSIPIVRPEINACVNFHRRTILSVSCDYGNPSTKYDQYKDENLDKAGNLDGETHCLEQGSFGVLFRHIQSPDFLWGLYAYEDSYRLRQGSAGFHLLGHLYFNHPERDNWLHKWYFGTDFILLPSAQFEVLPFPIQVTIGGHYNWSERLHSETNNQDLTSLEKLEKYTLNHDSLWGIQAKMMGDWPLPAKTFITFHYCNRSNNHRCILCNTDKYHHTVGGSIGFEYPWKQRLIKVSGTYDNFLGFQLQTSIQIQLIKGSSLEKRSLQNYLTRPVDWRGAPLLLHNKDYRLDNQRYVEDRVEDASVETKQGGTVAKPAQEGRQPWEAPKRGRSVIPHTRAQSVAPVDKDHKRGRSVIPHTRAQSVAPVGKDHKRGRSVSRHHGDSEFADLNSASSRHTRSQSVAPMHHQDSFHKKTSFFAKAGQTVFNMIRPQSSAPRSINTSEDDDLSPEEIKARENAHLNTMIARSSRSRNQGVKTPDTSNQSRIGQKREHTPFNYDNAEGSPAQSRLSTQSGENSPWSSNTHRSENSDSNYVSVSQCSFVGNTAEGDGTCDNNGSVSAEQNRSSLSTSKSRDEAKVSRVTPLKKTQEDKGEGYKSDIQPRQSQDRTPAKPATPVGFDNTPRSRVAKTPDTPEKSSIEQNKDKKKQKKLTGVSNAVYDCDLLFTLKDREESEDLRYIQEYAKRINEQWKAKRSQKEDMDAIMQAISQLYKDGYIDSKDPDKLSVQEKTLVLRTKKLAPTIAEISKAQEHLIHTVFKQMALLVRIWDYMQKKDPDKLLEKINQFISTQTQDRSLFNFDRSAGHTESYATMRNMAFILHSIRGVMTQKEDQTMYEMIDKNAARYYWQIIPGRVVRRIE